MNNIVLILKFYTLVERIVFFLENEYYTFDLLDNN